MFLLLQVSLPFWLILLISSFLLLALFLCGELGFLLSSFSPLALTHHLCWLPGNQIRMQELGTDLSQALAFDLYLLLALD